MDKKEQVVQNKEESIMLNRSVTSDCVCWFAVQGMLLLYTKGQNNVLYCMSHHMGKPTIRLGENKGADKLRINCEADQRLCFRYSDSTIPLLLKSKVSSF